jgi:GTPase
MEEKIGRITHYFSKINVCVIELDKGELRVRDTIHIKGHTTDFYQKVHSLQIEHSPVDAIKAGESAGLKVESPARENDLVLKVTEE